MGMQGGSLWWLLSGMNEKRMSLRLCCRRLTGMAAMCDSGANRYILKGAKYYINIHVGITTSPKEKTHICTQTLQGHKDLGEY